MATNKKDQVALMSRRQFLSMAGMASCYYAYSHPFNMLFTAIVDGMVSSAHAEASGAPAKGYLAILLGGAPTRWVWDSFLTPNGTRDLFYKNGSVNNWIPTNTYTGNSDDTDYRAEEIVLAGSRPGHADNIWMSPIWNRDIPVADGTWAPMKDLLQNAMLIRGVDMGQDVGHTLGPAKCVRAETSQASLTGMVADHSETPIKSVGLSWRSDQPSFAETRLGAYKSLEGNSVSIVRDAPGRRTNPLSKILNGFLEDPSIQSFQGKTADLKPEMDAALFELEALAKSSLPGADILYANRDAAEKMMLRSFGNLTEVFNTLLVKYQNLEKRSATPLANILPGNTGNGYNPATGGNVQGMAAQFAVAEFLFTNNLSKSVTITLQSSPAIGGLFNKHDEHGESDRQKSLMCITYEFRALAAMINEFKRAIGSEWENTVVQVGAEYDRSPGGNKGGSDHAANSNMFTTFSGAITKPLLIGNITAQNYRANGEIDSRYPGTWGASAPVRMEGKLDPVTITNKIAISTVATLLGVPTPTRSESLIEIVGGTVRSLAEKPKNV